MPQTVGNIDRQSGGEDGGVTGWSSANPSHSRNIGLPLTAGGLSKQKSPVANDSQTTKDLVLYSSNFMRSIGSSRRPVVSDSRDPVIAGSDSDRARVTDASPGALQKISSAAQKSWPALSSDPKNTATDRNISNIKNLEPTLKGIEGLNFNTNERLHY